MTRRLRKGIVMAGGIAIHFIADGIDKALKRAKEGASIAYGRAWFSTVCAEGARQQRPGRPRRGE